MNAAMINTTGSISAHEHTKLGCTVFIVSLADRLERADFARLRYAAETRGGWYSKPWGPSPGGFAFRERATAETFMLEHLAPPAGFIRPDLDAPVPADASIALDSEDAPTYRHVWVGAHCVLCKRDYPGADRPVFGCIPPRAEQSAPHIQAAARNVATAFGEAANPQVAQRMESIRHDATITRAANFRRWAEPLEAQAAAKLADRLENTPKRRAQAARSRLEGLRLQRTVKVLYALRDLLLSDNAPAWVDSIRTRKDVYDRMAAKLERIPNGFHEYTVECQPPQPQERADELARKLWTLLEHDPQAEHAEQLRRALAKVGPGSYPGFFPTPPPVVARMLEIAEIEITHTVLEPSAGTGAIACAIPEEAALVVVFEIVPALCDVLRLRGFDAQPVDFLAMTPRAFAFDRVLMNPPFENLQDIDHVRHAYNFLKPGGRLVAVMSPGWTYRGDRKAADFRQWFHEINGEREDLPAGSFIESGTGANAVLITIDKPRAAP